MIDAHGDWVGWGPGDAGTPISEAKKELKRKFSYAAVLSDSPMYTTVFGDVLREYQSRKNVDLAKQGRRLLRTDGILDWYTQKVLGSLPEPPKKIVIFTVSGTGAPWDVGYPFDLARWQDQSQVYVQPIGYPAAAFPMGPSVNQGVNELVRQMHIHLDGENDDVLFILIGYSQGAIVTSKVLRRMMSGDLAGYLDRCIAGVTFGNPMREEHHFTGASDPGGHGLDPECLENTPAWWHDYAAKGDIYTCGSGNDDAATMEDMTAIYLAVMGHLVLGGHDSLTWQVIEAFTNPFGEVPAMIKAIASGIGFIAQSPPTAPHIEYHIRECFPGVTYFDHAFDYVRRVVAARSRIE